jgi:hypothetical protein
VIYEAVGEKEALQYVIREEKGGRGAKGMGGKRKRKIMKDKQYKRVRE